MVARKSICLCGRIFLTDKYYNEHKKNCLVCKPHPLINNQNIKPIMETIPVNKRLVYNKNIRDKEEKERQCNINKNKEMEIKKRLERERINNEYYRLHGKETPLYKNESLIEYRKRIIETTTDRWISEEHMQHYMENLFVSLGFNVISEKNKHNGIDILITYKKYAIILELKNTTCITENYKGIAQLILYEEEERLKKYEIKIKILVISNKNDYILKRLQQSIIRTNLSIHILSFESINKKDDFIKSFYFILNNEEKKIMGDSDNDDDELINIEDNLI